MKNRLTATMESQPLIPQAFRQKSNRKRVIGFSAAAVLIIYIVITLSVVLSNLEAYVNESVRYTAQSISIVDLNPNDEGIDLLIKGNMSVNYHQVENKFASGHMIMAGKIIRELNLDLDQVDLIAEDGPKSHDKLGKVIIEPFKVNVATSESQPLDLFLTLYPHDSGILSILKKLLKKPGVKFRLYGDTRVKVMTAGRSFPLAKFRLNLDQTVDTLLGLMDEMAELESIVG